MIPLHMNPQVATLRKLFSAVFTLEWFFLEVKGHVVLQGALAPQVFLTLVTLEFGHELLFHGHHLRMLSCNVLLQELLASKGLRAKLASSFDFRELCC